MKQLLLQQKKPLGKVQGKVQGEGPHPRGDNQTSETSSDEERKRDPVVGEYVEVFKVLGKDSEELLGQQGDDMVDASEQKTQDLADDCPDNGT